MSWFQQPNNSWQTAEAEADADMLAGRMGQQNRAISELKKYAAQLQAALDENGAMYDKKVGDERAQARLKDLGLVEIQRLDPSNKLLDPEYRKEVGKKVRDETAREFAKEKDKKRKWSTESSCL